MICAHVQGVQRLSLRLRTISIVERVGEGAQQGELWESVQDAK